MPNSIERDVYVLRDTLKNPISYVRGTDLLPIILHFRDFAIPSGATAKVFVAKNDGNAVYGGATITGNDVTVDVTQQMFITLGVNLMQVEIDSGNETLVTFEQPVMVTPNLKAGDLPDSTTDVDFIDKIIEQAQEAVNDANAALETANTAISGANTAAESANSAAQNANNVAEELQDKVDAGDFTASVQVGTTTTLDPDQDATVSNSGTNKDVVLNFGIPKGDPGTAASIQVGTTQTVQPNENAEVTNTGTTTAAVLNFKIPRGADGMTDLVARYEDASEYTATPTADAPVVIIDLNGKTQQTTTNGYQLFDASKLPSKTQGGAIVTNNGDGSFTISGSGNLTSGFYNLTYSLTPEDTKKYFKARKVYGLRNKSFVETYPYFRVMATINSESQEMVEGFEITEEMLQDELFYVSFDILGTSGVEIQPGTIKPMIYQDGDGTWEPFSGGQPTPSPDYPQVIKGVGGMGYFDGEWRQGVYQSLNGAWQAAGNGICSQNPIKAKAGDNVALKYPDKATLVILAYKSDGTYLGNNAAQNANEVSYALPTDTAYVHIDVQMAQGVSITPSTAKYCTVTVNGEHQTGVEVTGVNLFDANEFKTYSFNSATVTNNGDGSFTISGSGSLAGVYLMIKTYSHDETLKMIKSGTLNLSCGFQTCPYVEVYLSTSNGNKNYLKNSTDGFSSTEIENETLNDETCKLVVRFYGQAGDTIIPGTIRPMLYQFGDGTYQPYHHTALSIPLTSPLYEGDKICYVKPGESYIDENGDTVIADRILYGVYRENAVVVFDGSESWFVNNKSSYQSFGCYKNEVKYAELKCNRFIYYESNTVAAGNALGIGLGLASNGVYIAIANGITNTLDEFKTWLSENPTEVVYKLAQPWFEPFNNQTPFYNLRSFDNLTYIYSDDPLNPALTVDVAKNQTGGYIFESLAQAMKNAQKVEAAQSLEARIRALETQAVENI